VSQEKDQEILVMEDLPVDGDRESVSMIIWVNLMKNSSILSCKIKIKAWFTHLGGKHKMMTNFKELEVLIIHKKFRRKTQISKRSCRIEKQFSWQKWKVLIRLKIKLKSRISIPSK
jgi:hypothetical protein